MKGKGNINRLFDYFTTKVSYSFAIVLFTLCSAWIAAGYASSFIYAAIEFSPEESRFSIFVLSIGLILATSIHSMHFGLFHKYGISGFSSDIRFANKIFSKSLSGNSAPGDISGSDLFKMIDSLYSMPRKNFFFSTFYSLLYVIITAIIYYIFFKKMTFVVLLVVSGSAACLIYGYTSFFISEYLTGPLRIALEHKAYMISGKSGSRYLLSLKAKTAFAIFLVLFSMVLLTIVLKRTDDPVKLTMFISESVFTSGILIALFGKSFTISLEHINDTAQRLAKGEKGLFFPFFTEREIVEFSSNFNRTAIEISELRHNLQKKVEQQTEEIQAAMEEMEAVNENLVAANSNLEEARRIADFDMKIAANLQKSLLPESAPESAQWDISFRYNPKSGVSGDFYDFYTKDSTLQGLSVFDVSGHGVAAGLITMIARSVIRRNFFRDLDENLSTVEKRINSELMNDIGGSEFYLSGLLLRIKDDTVEYVNAAHPDILVKRGNIVRRIIPEGNKDKFRGFFLGCRDMEMSSTVVKFRIRPGDSIILFTDCLSEGKNPEGQNYDEHGLDTALSNAPGSTSREIADFIIDDFVKFTGSSVFNDDLTVIVLTRKNA